MSPTVWVPCDAAAVAVGADAVAEALTAAGSTVRRNGSRGMLWLEPLVEIETDGVRVGYSNVDATEVETLLAGGLDDTERAVGVVDEHPWLARQHRVSFARVGLIEPTDLAAYRAHGGLVGLERAITLAGEQVVQEVTDSGLRGRGGAGFPAGIKWETVRTAAADVKFVCCNADEGDSGTFADRMLIEGDPFTLIEGMAIAAVAVGATEGFVYLRSEYPHAIRTLRRAIDIAYAHGLLGASVLGSGLRFDLDVRVGAGAYICGEETSMLESLEGKRGEVRAKPPIPALQGLFDQPTVVNNVLTLAAVPMVLADGGAAYAALGTGRSRGTQVFQLAGNIACGGIVEADFGISLGELVDGFGGGAASGRPVKAVQVGGPLGAYLPPARFELPMDYEVFAEAGAMVGHGGIVVWDDTMDASTMARFAMEFCAKESCGKCTPCRIGSVRGVEVIDRVRSATDDGVRRTQLDLLEDLCTTMTKGSLCAMGGLTPMPVRSALEHFPEDFGLPPSRALNGDPEAPVGAGETTAGPNGVSGSSPDPSTSAAADPTEGATP
ncbi:MAG: NADH-ubiquinone oxidoreductase-F iron-sulfur binding region domain-containing protein [Ornithinibacter sp.]